MIEVPQYILNEGDFTSIVDSHNLNEDDLIEWMVFNGWTIGKEIDTKSVHYPHGNIYFPPEEGAAL